LPRSTVAPQIYRPAKHCAGWKRENHWIDSPSDYGREVHFQAKQLSVRVREQKSDFCGKLAAVYQDAQIEEELLISCIVQFYAEPWPVNILHLDQADLENSLCGILSRTRVSHQRAEPEEQRREVQS
jgi:hypothetical protein